MKKFVKAVIIAGVMMTGLFTASADKVVGVETPQEKNYATELFMVQNEVQDNTGNYLQAVSLEEKTNAPYGYILDDKYNVGDIVEVTYHNDDIFSERKITGKELTSVEKKYAEKIDVVENTLGKEFTTELFTVQYVVDNGDYLIAMPLEEKTNAPYGYVLDNKYELGDIVEVTYCDDDILSEGKITGDKLNSVKQKYEGEIDYYMDVALNG